MLKKLKWYINDPSLLYSRSNDPDFLIIGAQKAGTSSLFNWLNYHPQMRGSLIKETHYFNTKIHFGMDHQAYKRHFRGKATNHFEATPAYLYHPRSCENIHQRYPNIRLIVVLRDPIERAFSAYNHYKRLYHMWEPDGANKNNNKRDGFLFHELFFEDRLEFPSFRECIDIEMHLLDKPEIFEPALLRRGIYLPQIQQYLKYFDRKNMLILGFKDLVVNTAETLNNICSFLKIDNFDWNLATLELQNRHMYTEKLSDIDRILLEDFYREPNQKLYETFGPFNW